MSHSYLKDVDVLQYPLFITYASLFQLIFAVSIEQMAHQQVHASLGNLVPQFLHEVWDISKSLF